MAGRRGVCVRAMAAAVAGLGLMAAGCLHHSTAGPLAYTRTPPQAYPVPTDVPVELRKQSLPEYVIEPPDVLRIEVPIVTKKSKDDPADAPDVQLRSLPIQPVWGEYTVRVDGTVYLGVYGSVPVAGLTLKQAAAAVREAVAKQVLTESGGIKPENLLVVLDVTQYQSKKYYVIFDGGGNGEQMFSFPVLGSETVLDALTNLGGLPAASSKRNVWVARRTPHADARDNILPVDLVGITQHGLTATNYQLLPGDRVYVKAQHLVTVDTALAKVLSPIERLFGVTLLGSATVNSIQGRNSFGSNNN